MAGRAGMEKLLFDVMELKNKEGIDAAGLLILLSLVNLMGLIELIGEEDKPKTNKPGEIILPLGRVPVGKG